MINNYITYYQQQARGGRGGAPPWHAGGSAKRSPPPPPVFISRVYKQRGRGLGSIFRSISKIAKPFLSKGLKAIKQEALTSGSHLLQDILSGENVKSSLKKRSKETAQNLRKRALNQLTGEGLITPSFAKRRRRGRKKKNC